MKNKLKITYLDFDDIRNPLLGAGQANATMEVCSRLVNMGHKVEVICSKYPSYENRIEKGIKYTHFGLGSKYIRLNNLIYILSLPFIVRKLKSDLVVECFTSPISTLFSPLFTKISVIALTTSFEAVQFSKKYHLPFDKIETFGLRFYNYFLPTSEFYKKKIRKINPDAVTKVISQGVDKKFLKLKIKKGKYILFLGRFDIDQKGIDLLLKAYSGVAAKIKYPLLFAGCGPDEKKIKDLVKQYKLTNKISFIGPTYGKGKLKVFSQAQLFAVPSRHEGFCIAALEAIAVGLPIVSFNIPGLSWIPKEVSLKAKAFDIDEYADYLIKACNKTLNLKLRKKCKKVVEKYSWDDVANKYDRYFRFVVNEEIKNNEYPRQI